MKNVLIGLMVVGVLVFLFSAYKIYTNKTLVATITSYEECVAAGYPILESYPEQCKTPGGMTFTNPNTIPVTPPTDENPSPTTPPTGTTNEQKVSAATKTALAKELKIDEKTIAVVEIKMTDWPNGCLGLATADEMCTQAIVSGYKVTLSAQNKTYIYRTDTDGTVIRREK